MNSEKFRCHMDFACVHIWTEQNQNFQEEVKFCLVQVGVRPFL